MNTALPADPVSRPRPLEAVVDGTPTSDGAGVRLHRVLTQHWQQRLDPYLMLDAFHSENPDDYLAGFPPHPHRGFETITYMLAGRLRHRDSTGGHGLLEQGGVQWMTAGSGLIHSEMPEQEQGLMRGFQLWLNLPAQDKLCTPGYRDIGAAEIVNFSTASGAQVKLIAGVSHGLTGPQTRPHTEPLYLNVHLAAGAEFCQLLDAGLNAFVYVYEGALAVGAQAVAAGRMGVLANAPDTDGLRAQATGETRFLLIAGRPLREPIAQYGPFVMNSRAQLEQAFADYQRGAMGQLD